jgi:BolA family transcriptional regulator, general stress-responsive regulator
LGRSDFIGAHPGEIIIARIVQPDMFEAQIMPPPRPVEVARAERGAKLPRLGATGHAAAIRRALDPPFPFLAPRRHAASSIPKPDYIGRMIPAATAPVATEMTRRLIAALSPTRLELEDQSAHHVGHAGHDARGESHFALTIESPVFAGQSRIARQRAVHAALGDLLHNRVHALTIKALAPGD